jgi:hypothetical protein
MAKGVKIRHGIAYAEVRRPLPGIPMVQSADPRHSHNSRPGRVASFDGSCDGRVFVQRIVDAVLMVVAEVLMNQPSQVSFIEHDHVIQ